MQSELELSSKNNKLKIIRTSGDIEPFETGKISASLVKELKIDEQLGITVEETVLGLLNNKPVLFAADVRHLAAGALRELGFGDEATRYQKIGLSSYDIDQIVSGRNNENANIEENPESISGRIAGVIFKEYTMRNIFNKQERMAHATGIIHVHDLDYYAIRPFCFGADARDIAMYGLPPIKGWSHSCVSGPAAHGWVLALHLAKWIGCLTTEFAGGLGYDIVNLVLAPYIRGFDRKWAKQTAQCLVYELAQLFISRKGQSPFSSIMIYPEIPDEWKNVDAIGPGGIKEGTYGDYGEECKMMFDAIVDVFLGKDYNGKPFNFPKLEVAWRQGWEDKGHYDKVHELAIECGSPYYVNLDVLPAGTKTQCCRMALRGDKLFKYCQNQDKMGPENSQRMGSLQTVSLNFPMAAMMKRKGDSIEDVMRRQFKIAESILIKKKKRINDFLERRSILRFSSGLCGDRKYLDMDTAHLSIGFVGLNETVKALTNYELHEDETAVKAGENILKEMDSLCTEASDRNQTLFSSWETPGENSCGVLAEKTIKRYPRVPACGDTVNYFTNSDHPRYDASMNFFQRVGISSRLQKLVDGGTIFHIFAGAGKPDADTYKLFLEKILGCGIKYTALSFGYTTCNDCYSFIRGDVSTCPECGSTNLDIWDRVTGYASRVDRWNDAKKEERKSRVRVAIGC